MSCTRNTYLLILGGTKNIEKLRENFEVKNLRDVTPEQFQDYLEQFVKGDKVNPSFIRLLETTFQQLVDLEPSLMDVKDPEATIDLQESLIPVTIQEEFTFNSRSEALKTLFAEQGAQLLAFEKYISKQLIRHLFLNLKRDKQITNDEQLMTELLNYVNSLSKQIINKPIVDVDAKELIKTNYYELNHQINELLKDKSILQQLVPNEKENKKGINGIRDKSESAKEIRKIVSAIIIANFNTILKEYLPIIEIDSDFSGFDVENLKNGNLFALKQRHQPKGKGFEQEGREIERSSKLQKLLIASFDTIQMIPTKGKMKFVLDSDPKFSLANYYYVASILSVHINKNNYPDNFKKLVTALLQSQLETPEGVNLLTTLDENVIGPYDTEYINNGDFKDLLSNVTHRSVLATMYYNLLLSENDILFSDPDGELKDKFSIQKYYAKYGGKENFDKNNLGDIIYSTFSQITPRNYHDIQYNSDRKQNESSDLGQKFINKQSFAIKKVHRYLTNRSLEMHRGYVVKVTENSFVLKYKGKEITYIHSGGWNTGAQETEYVLALYEVFRQITNLDLINEPLLANTAEFSLENVQTVTHAMLNLYEKSLTDENLKRLLESEKPLQKGWENFKAKGTREIDSILGGMGSMWGKMIGIYSKMTVLSRDGKPLPTFGNTAMIYEYRQRLLFLKDIEKNHLYLDDNNIFIRNPKLFQGVSSKNQIAVNGVLQEYKSANLSDQVITDIFFEWFQKRRLTENKEEKNYIHIQPLVYADKTQQMCIKIPTDQKIEYPNFSTGNAFSEFTINNVNSFTKDTVNKLKEITFNTLHGQYRKYFLVFDEGLNNILKKLNVEYIPELGESSSQGISKKVNLIKANSGEKNILQLWKEHSPKIPLISDQYFDGKGNVNNIQLFYFDLYAANQIQPTETDKKLFNNFMNLGLIQFLFDVSEMNIIQENPNLKIVEKDNIYIKDINAVLKPEIKNKLAEANAKIQNIVLNSKGTDLNNLINLIWPIEQELQGILEETGYVYQQFFWEKELFGHNFELTGNGPIYLHPQKAKGTTLYADLLERLGASQKRNVTYQATVIPYTPNSIVGPQIKRKVLVYKDLKSTLINPMGESEDVKHHDGGEYILLLQRILENNSMPQYGNPKHHKSFIVGTVMNAAGKFFNTTLFKYASFSLNNIRLRKSKKYRNMVQSALTQPIPFYEMIDFTKTYLGKNIDYGKWNIQFETEDGKILKLRSLKHANQDNYIQSYTDQNLNLIEESVKINSLFDLYNVLGAHRTIESIAGKMYYNDQSWIALADIVNNVGFVITEEMFSNGIVDYYSKLSGNSIDDIFSAQSDGLFNQLNVIQPLKFAFISNFTPESCIKFGGKVGEKFDFSTPKIFSEDEIFHVHNTHAGIQQDTEHETDITTEVTQLVNGLALGNLSPELLTLYKDIANHVIQSMSAKYKNYQLLTDEKAFENDTNFLEHVEQLVFIFQKLKNQVLNSQYNSGQSQDLILSSANNFVEHYLHFKKMSLQTTGTIDQNEVRDIFKQSFRVSLSDQSIYNQFIVTLASINTKLGVRRKSAGTPAVMVPNSHFMTYVAIPSIINGVFDYEHYSTVTVDEFEDFLKTREAYKQLLLPENRYKLVYDENLGFGEFDIRLFEHYIVNGEKIYISNYKQYNMLKDRLYAGEIKNIQKDLLSGYDWEENAGRPLKPIEFDIKITNSSGTLKRTYNIYDTIATPLLFELKDFEEKWGSVSQDSNPEMRQELKEIKYKLQGHNIPGFREIHVDQASVKEFKNILQNLLNFEMMSLKKGIRIVSKTNEKDNKNNSDDVKFINFALKHVPDANIDDFNIVEEIKHRDAEIILGYYHAAKFGITNTMHTIDVTEDMLLQNVLKKVKEVDDIKLKTKRGKVVPMYIHTPNNNIYFFNKSNILSTIEELPKSFVKTNADGEKFIEFVSGQPIMNYIEELENLYYIYRINGVPVLMLNLDHPIFTSNLRILAELELSINKNSAQNAIWIDNIEEGEHPDRRFLQVGSDQEIVENIENFEQIFDVFAKNTVLGLDKDGKHSNQAKSLAKNMYSSYLMSLRHASSRIPGQDYQSFSGTMITNFLHDEQNSILVSDYNIWLTGGDYDIDKLYNMGYYLNDKGIFISWNRLFNLTSYHHLKISMDLELPQRIQFFVDEGVRLNETYKETGLTGIQILRNYLSISKGKIKKLNNVSLKNFKLFVELYNDIIQNGLSVNHTDVLEDRDLTALIEFLEPNLKNNNNIEKQLENKIVKGTRDNLTDIRNTVASYSPVTMDGPKQLKARSQNEAIAKTIHPNNPIAIPKAVFNQYAGKSVVGINAAGLKLYATLSYVVVQDLTSKKFGSLEEFKKALFHTRIVKKIDGDTIKYTVSNAFAGIEYSLNKEQYTEQLKQLYQDNNINKQSKQQLEEDIEQKLFENYQLDRVQLQISQMLSAATDNGKEMILGIINQGEKSQGMYLYALMLGYSLDTVGDIMISEPVTKILKWLNRSILLNEKPRDIMSLLSYFTNGVKLKHFVPGSTASLAFELNTKTADLEALSLQDTKGKYSSLAELEKAMEEKKEILMKLPLELAREGEEDFSDYIVDTEWESDNQTPTTYDAYTALRNFIKTAKEVREINANPKYKQFVNIFTYLADGSRILAAVTQLLGANQAVKSTDVDLLKQIISFEDSIRNYALIVPKENEEDKPTLENINRGTNAFQQQTLTEQEINDIKTFDLVRFFSSEPYAQGMIKVFDKIRQDLNPLYLIHKAEHFRAMINTSIQTDRLYYKHTVVYRTLRNVISKGEYLDNKEFMLPLYGVSDDGSEESKGLTVGGFTSMSSAARSLPEDAFNQLKNVIDTVFLNTTLQHLQEHLIRTNSTIRIEKSEKEKGIILNLQEYEDLGSTQGRKSFVEFMEKVFIPRLKEGKLSAEDESNPDIKNNEFVKALTLADFRRRSQGNKFFTAYGILLPKLTDDVEVKIRQNSLQEALYALQNISHPNLYGASIVDLLFLYNTIVHRKKDGEFTLTAFFSPDKQYNSILHKFNAISNLIDENYNILPIEKENLRMFGFHSGVNPRILIPDIGDLSSIGYKAIALQKTNIEGDLELSKANTLEDKLKIIFSLNNQDTTNINFECS